jgi:hypothetical protein
VIVLIAVSYAIWMAMESVRPVDVSEAGKPNPFVLQNKQYADKMGPTPEQMEYAATGAIEAVEVPR